MDTLTAAAKASAVGLGETRVVADAVTSAVTAYGSENLSAARSTEVLLLAIREGKLEAASLGGVIGRVLPIAKQLGVSFEEVAAFVAAVSRQGLNAEEAITSLRGALNALIGPTDQQIEAAVQFLNVQNQHYEQARPAGIKDSPQKLALASFCQALISSNAFLYVD